jgi:hypothetical protein
MGYALAAPTVVALDERERTNQPAILACSSTLVGNGWPPPMYFDPRSRPGNPAARSDRWRSSLPASSTYASQTHAEFAPRRATRGGREIVMEGQDGTVSARGEE